MKRTFVIIAALTFALTAFAQENPGKGLKSRIFTIEHRDPHSVADAIKLLGSGVGLASINVNTDLHTITVRDFPENLASMDEAIKRLDQPQAAQPTADLRISVLIGSKTPLAGGIPDDLQPVVKELQSVLRYTHYELVATAVQHITPGISVADDGIVSGAPIGTKTEWPATFHYRLDRPTITSGERQSIVAQDFDFRLKAPFDRNGVVDYQSVGFNTPVTVRDGENVVIGTTTVGDKALIVVVNAKIGGK